MLEHFSRFFSIIMLHLNAVIQPSMEGTLSVLSCDASRRFIFVDNPDLESVEPRVDERRRSSRESLYKLFCILDHLGISLKANQWIRVRCDSCAQGTFDIEDECFWQVAVVIASYLLLFWLFEVIIQEMQFLHSLRL